MNAKKSILWSLLALLFLLALLPIANANVTIPPLRSPVTDLTQTLSSAQSASLEQRLRAFEASKGSQVAVLIVPTTEPESIEQYSVRVEEAWKLGRKNIDDSVLLVIAKNDHKLHIEVGYGLEGALPDAIASRIINEAITPQFKAGNFYGGIVAGVDQITGVINGEPLPEPAHRPINSVDTLFDIPQAGSSLPLVLMAILIGGGILRAIFGRFIGSGIAAGAAGLIAWLLLSALSISIIAAIIAFVFTIFGGGLRGGILGSGFGGMSGGSFGGGGGWSGGGGGSGGGGASGSW